MSNKFSELEIETFYNANQVIDFFNDICGSIEDVEDVLGIEFAYENGIFPSDDESNEFDSLDIDLESYRVINLEAVGALPDKYPCQLFSGGIDGPGGFSIVFIKFVDGEKF